MTGNDGFSELGRSDPRTRDAALLRATTKLYALDDGHSAEENRRYEELAIHLLPKVGRLDRQFVADHLATVADAPASVIRILARDAIEIATPVIRNSPVLDSFELLSIIAGTDAEHHEAVASRDNLPVDVRGALIRTGNPHVAAILDGEQGDVPFTGQATSDSSDDNRTEDEDDAQAGDPVLSEDAWTFLNLDRTKRLRHIAQLASDPLIMTREDAGGAEAAFRKMLGTAQVIGHARGGKTAEMTAAISNALELPREFVSASVEDPTGEAFAVLLKALRLDDVTAQQVFLMTSPAGRNVEAFFPLTDFYSGMEPVVAEAVLSEWRGLEKPAQTPKHEAHMAENGRRRSDRVHKTHRRRTSLPNRADRTG